MEHSNQQQTQTRRRAGGRPTLPDELRRIVSLSITFTKSEAEKVMDFADRAGLTPNEWARKATLNSPITTVPSINRATYSELGKLASNLNQIARKLNIGDEVAQEAKAAAIQAFDEIQKLRQELMGGKNNDHPHH